MAISTQPYKGARDFYPEDMRVQQYMFDIWREVCERFGYEEYNAPVLEPLELFTAKTSEEIVNEQTYSFTDRGGRQVVMRPEMTPSVSRMVAARRQELGYPVRLYSIPNCFRYERPQRGRLREFWQLNADLFGVESMEADLEAITLSDAIMKAFGATEDMYEIRLSSRQYINDAFDRLELDEAQRKTCMALIDKKEKIDARDWEKLFVEVLEEQKAGELLKFLNDESVPAEIEELLGKLRKRGVGNVKFNKFVARGFEYYTDVVFEIFDTNPENNRSMFGGGRYDGLVGQFGVEPVATVGFGMGDITLQNFLASNNLLPELAPATDICAILIGDVADEALAVIGQLREGGLNVSVDFGGRKADKQIKAAVKRGAPYVLFIGEAELASGQFTLKNLESGQEEKCGVEEIARVIENSTLIC